MYALNTPTFNNYNLSAQFGVTKDGKHFCLYEKSDEKAIMIARNEFAKKCRELDENMTVEKQDNFYVISDKHSGQQISFDNIPSRAELSEQIQKNFGYEKNKADIACAKFAQENLSGIEKAKFTSNNPQNNFSKIDTNITIQGESIFAKNYTCWRVVPKSDSLPRIVFQNENGNFAVLNPEKMTRKNMSKILNEQLQINDSQTVNALINKAEKICDFYAKQDSKNFSHSLEFDETEIFEKYSETLKSSVDTDFGAIHRIIPKSIETSIERNDKNSFTITANFTGTDNINIIGGGQENHPVTDVQKMKFSFSDKKNALNQLTELYKNQGIPEDIARQIAKEVFEKAESQSAEKVLHIEEIRAETQSKKTETIMAVSSGNQFEEFDITDPEKAVSEIAEKFEVTEETAEILMEKAQEMMENLHEETKKDVPDLKKATENSDIPDIPELPEVPDIPAGRGGR